MYFAETIAHKAENKIIVKILSKPQKGLQQLSLKQNPE